MSSAFNHKTRSRKTYRGRMAAARYFCNYNMTRLQRLLAQARLMNAFQKEGTESEPAAEVDS